MLKIDSIDSYHSDRILSFNRAIDLVSKLKSQGKTIGLCHGGFDLLHPGHVKHFESAKKLCDILLVSVTSDKFVKSRKGSGRPIYPDKLRAYMIANIQHVNYVIISNFERGTEVINLLKPSFYIKGPDYIKKTSPGIIAERKVIERVGGIIKYTQDPTFSTTEIIKYIKNEL